jgi:hypothetical protein
MFKSPRRLRKEKQERIQKRMKEKNQLKTLVTTFKNKESKINYLKTMEKSKTFQTDFIKMKSLLMNPKAVNVGNMDNFIKNYDQTKGKLKDRTKMKKMKDDEFWRL